MQKQIFDYNRRKGDGKVVVVHTSESTEYSGAEVQLRSCLISVLDEGDRSTSSPGRFTSLKELRYTFNRGLGWLQSRYSRSGEETNDLSLQRFELQTVQPVV